MNTHFFWKYQFELIFHNILSKTRGGGAVCRTAPASYTGSVKYRIGEEKIKEAKRIKVKERRREEENRGEGTRWM